MKTKALLLLLAVCMIVSALAGCSSRSYDYDLGDYLKLGTYKGIKLLDANIVHDLMDEYQSAVDDYDDAEKIVVKTVYNSDTEGVKDIFVFERSFTLADTVNIDYEGKVDGEKFNGGTATGYDLVIGSDSFISGFEDGLIGAQVGDTRVLELTFPEGYDEITFGEEGSKDYRKIQADGKDVVFTVKINSITRKTYPEYNDDNVKKYTDYETVAELEEKTRETAEKNLLWEELYKNSKVIKYPEKELREYYDNYVDSYMSSYTSILNYLSERVTFEEYLKSFYGFSDISSFFTDCAQDAQKQVKQEMILYSMLEAVPTLKLGEKSYEEKAYALWEEYCEDENYEGSYKEFKKDFTREAIEKTLYYDIVIDYIRSECVIEKKNGLVESKYGTRYYIDDVMQKGWQKVDLDGDGVLDKCYFDKSTGYLAIGGAYAVPENGGEDAKELFWEFTDKGIFVGLYNGLYNSGSNTLYYVDGEYQTGWQTVEEKEYYFFDTGYAAKGDVTVKNKSGDEEIICRFDKDTGVFEKQLIDWIDTTENVYKKDDNDEIIKDNEGNPIIDYTITNTRYYYYYKDGETGKWAYAMGEFKPDGSEYTFYFESSNGYLVKPEGDPANYGDEFVKVKGEKVYAFKKVTIGDRTVYAINTELNGKYQIDEGEGDNKVTVTYFFKNGIGQIGWQFIDGDTYYFDTSDGKMVTGTKEIADVEYTFDNDGKLTSTTLSGLVKDGSKRLVYVENGEFKTGLVEVEGNKYFFDADHFVAKSGWIDADGDEKADYYAAEDYIIVVSKTVTIDEKSYEFDENGNFTEADTASEE